MWRGGPGHSGVFKIAAGSMSLKFLLNVNSSGACVSVCGVESYSHGLKEGDQREAKGGARA